MKGTIWSRKGHADPEDSFQVDGNISEIEAVLRGADYPNCGCCMPAYRGENGVDADLDPKLRICWSLGPTQTEGLGLGYFRLGIKMPGRKTRRILGLA